MVDFFRYFGYTGKKELLGFVGYCIPRFILTQNQERHNSFCRQLISCLYISQLQLYTFSLIYYFRTAPFLQNPIVVYLIIV